jgi:hypothetical protein
MHALLTQAQADLNLPEGEFAMFIPDMPALPPQSSSIVMIAQTNQAQLSTKKAERVLGVCKVIANEERKDGNGEIYPNSTDLMAVEAAEDYLTSYENRTDLTVEDAAAAKTTVLSQPKHGTLKEDVALNGEYFYFPDADYVGKDSAEVLVEIKGIKVKVRYFFHLETTDPGPNAYELYCEERGGQWKIATLPTPTDLATQQANPALATILANASLSFTGFADLAGGALGQTTGSTITLDTTAAGNNWFIDPSK